MHGIHQLKRDPCPAYPRPSPSNSLSFRLNFSEAYNCMASLSLIKTSHPFDVTYLGSPEVGGHQMKIIEVTLC